ncbi:MAG: Gfo/Idh/MocA family oxidoreductase [Paludibaculum sp.]
MNATPPKQLAAGSPAPLRVALVGCGQIADAHLQEIAKLSSARVVATCDALRDLAMQAAARFNVPAVYDDLALMLAEVRPDVVHIATPAHTHFDLARQCLLAGCHVYVEKPFTQTAAEAETLVAIARESGLQITVGHDQLFDPAWLDLEERIARGEIGSVTHVESVLGYPISGQFGSQVSGDPRHWVRRLPGGLFQNTISHPLYRITEFLTDVQPKVIADWARRPGLDFPTELNVVLRGEKVTGTLTFSSSIPSQRNHARLWNDGSTRSRLRWAGCPDRRPRQGPRRVRQAAHAIRSSGGSETKPAAQSVAVRESRHSLLRGTQGAVRRVLPLNFR